MDTIFGGILTHWNFLILLLALVDGITDIYGDIAGLWPTGVLNDPERKGGGIGVPTEPGMRGPADPGNGGGGGGPADPGKGGGGGTAEPGNGGGGGIPELGKGGGMGGPADPGKGGGGGGGGKVAEPGKAGGGGGTGGVLPGNGDKNDPPRGGGGGGGGVGITDGVAGVDVNPGFGGGIAGIGVEDIVDVSMILFSSIDCFAIIDLSSSSSEFNKKPPCSCLFMFEHRFTNFSTVSQTTSIKLSSSVIARRLCKICKKFVA